ncbi:hypothetical protein [Gelidibacter mesophilus]|uniref:hypothetical protein n=1 Tax=Gelidibacter mesophilus TaxID=169050 RepID=UPI000401A8E8|nr:hypothetical protein [Gelidibacter mesophilus]
MRPILLIFSLFCASCLTINAQTNTWTGAGANTNWNTVANWSLNAVPTATNDVIIPTGHTVTMNVAGTMKSISVQGNSTLNILNALTFTNASSFAKGTTIVWSGGGFYGGGVLTNNGTLNMTTSATKYIADGTIVNNNSLINMNGSFTLYINSGSINNQNSGIIDIQARPNLAPNTGQSHQITNSGIIKKTGDTGAATISVAMINTGAINVDSGILNLTSEAKTFDGGEYNVTTDATLNLSTAISLSGTMTGLVNGDLNWNSVLTVADEATFNFTGTSGINWVDGFLDGGGVLNNISRMNLITRNTKYIRGFTILNNTGLLNLSDSFTLYINAGTLRNLSTGIIDIQALPHLALNTGEAHSIVNAGLIKKTTNTGVATISMALINTGTISV